MTFAHTSPHTLTTLPRTQVKINLDRGAAMNSFPKLSLSIEEIKPLAYHIWELYLLFGEKCSNCVADIHPKLNIYLLILIEIAD